MTPPLSVSHPLGTLDSSTHSTVPRYTDIDIVRDSVNQRNKCDIENNPTTYNLIHHNTHSLQLQRHSEYKFNCSMPYRSTTTVAQQTSRKTTKWRNLRGTSHS